MIAADPNRPAQPKTIGFLASQADVAVLLCRENAKTVSLWRLDWQQGEPTLRRGSLFRGQTYPYRCDISPDGERFLYFAMGDGRAGYPERLYCWSAICAPPSITALKLWPHGDTWGGGGAFLDDGRIAIAPGMNPGFDPAVADEFEGHEVVFDGDSSGCNERGWRLVTLREDAGGSPQPDCWRKQLAGHQLQRIHLDFSLGIYSHCRYRLIDEASGRQRDFDGCQWVDSDRHGRIFASQGRRLWIYPDAAAAMDGCPQYDLVLS